MMEKEDRDVIAAAMLTIANCVSQAIYVGALIPTQKDKRSNLNDPQKVYEENLKFVKKLNTKIGTWAVSK